MSPTTSDNLKRIEQLAAERGISGEYNLLRGEFVVLFGLPGGRSQEVYVSEFSPNESDAIITFRSTCLVIEREKFPTFASAITIELLTMNEKLNFVRYGIQETEDSYIVVASYDLLMDNLDADGLEVYFECVALAADSYEEKFGRDEF